MKIYPFKTVEAGARRQLVDRVGEQGARTLFGRRGVRGLANVDITPELAVTARDGLRHRAQEGRDRRHLAATSSRVGPHAQAGDDGRAQLGRRQRDGPRARDACRSPGSRCAVSRAQGGISVRLVPDDPDSRRDPLLRRRRAPTSTEDAQRKIERLLPPRGLPAGVRRRDRRHRVPARALEFYTAALEASVDVEPIASARVQGRARLLVRRDVDRDAERAGQARRRRAGRQPVREHRGATAERLETRVKFDRRVSCALRDPISVSSSTPTARPRRSSTTRAPRSRRPGAARHREARVRATQNARIALPVSVSREAERIARPHGATITWTKLSAAHLMEVVERAVSRSRGLAGGRVHLAHVPAGLRRGRDADVDLLDLLAADERTLSSIVAELPETHVAYESVPTPWERKGAVMRGVMERAARITRRCSSTA